MTTTDATINEQQSETELRQQLPALALAAAGGDQGAIAALEQVEAEIAAAERQRERTVLAEQERQRLEGEARKQAAAEQLRLRRGALSAQRTASYRSVEKCTAALLQAMDEALALGDALGDNWGTKHAMLSYLLGELTAAGLEPAGLRVPRQPLPTQEESPA